MVGSGFSMVSRDSDNDTTKLRQANKILQGTTRRACLRSTMDALEYRLCNMCEGFETTASKTRVTTVAAQNNRKPPKSSSSGGDNSSGDSDSSRNDDDEGSKANIGDNGSDKRPKVAQSSSIGDSSSAAMKTHEEFGCRCYYRVPAQYSVVSPCRQTEHAASRCLGSPRIPLV